ncbi:MAG: hypothetical protein JNL61_01450 [Rhizobiaceae bacterium]|nr:hypothetical protein [Rhizobiaceae bacterium]
MAFPVPHPHPKPDPAPPAMVRTATREDVLWDRPVFKAPPLRLDPKALDASRVAQELPRNDLRTT